MKGRVNYGANDDCRHLPKCVLGWFQVEGFFLASVDYVKKAFQLAYRNTNNLGVMYLWAANVNVVVFQMMFWVAVYRWLRRRYSANKPGKEKS